MKINISKKEYKQLLDLIYIADWVLHAHETEEQNKNSDYEVLMQRLLSISKEMDCEDVVEFDKNLGKYFHTFQYEEESPAPRLIEKFEDSTFWSELITRLAERDAYRGTTEKNWQELSIEEKFSMISNEEEKWSKELEENGLDRIYAKTNTPSFLH